MRELTFSERMLVEQLAARHRTPKAEFAHPAVIVPGDEFMTEKLRDPDYVPYCLVKSECGRVRRAAFGFECPTCGNKMNYDLRHYDGNKGVQYAGEPPLVEVALSGFPPVPGEFWKFRQPGQTFGTHGYRSTLPPGLAQYRADYAERKAWNDAVAARKAAKKGSK